MASEAQFQVRVERNVLIPMSDGVSLAGDLYLPDAPGPFPTLIQSYPYHKDDVIGGLFDHPHRYFAARGYASLLVDLRGLGGSEGVAWDVMDPSEATDGAEIVEWAAAQSWSDGNVGMWGMSYGGLTALETAALRPPHLKAIAPMNAGTDNYKGTYPGGCFTGVGSLGTWGPWMIAMSLLPPLYQDRAGRWERVWHEHLDKARTPYVFPNQEHPTYDAYWQRKAIPVEKIEVPAYFWTSWRDQDPGAMTDAYTRVGGPRKLLVGPWMHWIPDLAAFDKVDYLAELTRWWDHWLKGEPSGIVDEPAVTFYVQGQGWRHEPDWPVPGEARTLYLAGEGLRGTLSASAAAAEGAVSYRADQTLGTTAGLWDPAGTGMGLPRDQGPDDLRSITFTGEPLSAELEITGRPEATLEVALDEGDEVHLVVKLCDVAPDGGSALITTGWLKGSHHHSHEHPEPLVPGAFTTCVVPLVPTSYRLAAGHRLRVSVSCSDFPRIWPTATNPLIRLATGGAHASSIRIPVVTSAGVPGPELPVPDPTIRRTPLDIEGAPRYRIEQDFATDTLTVTTGLYAALWSPERDGRFAMDRTARAVVSASRPNAARVEGEAILTMHTPGGSTVVAEGRSWVSLNGQIFTGRVTLDGQLIFEQRWQR